MWGNAEYFWRKFRDSDPQEAYWLIKPMTFFVRNELLVHTEARFKKVKKGFEFAGDFGKKALGMKVV